MLKLLKLLKFLNLLKLLKLETVEIVETVETVDTDIVVKDCLSDCCLSGRPGCTSALVVLVVQIWRLCVQGGNTWVG